ncbi:MAG: endonuclease III [Acidobacteria bacterium]|nr:endonuclease III [Acidobacteriota bacterium]
MATRAAGTAAKSRQGKGARPSGQDPVRVREIIKRLEKAYPEAQCALHHHNAWELLVATILSAQCTDERVNKVTPELFRKYPTPKDFAALRPEVLEAEIRSTGFFRNKTKSILGSARKIVQDFSGKVPDTMEELLTLPGVARKTANVVLGTAFRKATGVVVDTHVHRIAQRLDLSREKTPEKIEQDLMRIVPQSKWIDFSHQMIFHGRRCCTARSPKCSACSLENLCYSEDKRL